MSDDILNDIKDIFEITEYKIIEFKEIYGFTFVFKTKIIFIKDMIPSAEIKPLGIIYTQNNDYYFAPLDESADIEEIIEKFVKEEESFHFPQ